MNDLNLCGVTSDGRLWHTVRFANGSWQSTFGDVKAQAANNPGSFVNAGCAIAANGDLIILGVTSDGKLWHTIRFASGSWQPAFGDVKAQESNDPGNFFAISCVFAGSSDLNLCGATSDGKLWHTIRFANGSWQSTFGDVKAQAASDPGSFVNVGAASISSAVASQPLVYIADSPLQHDSSSATWASQVCQNQQFLRNETPVWEWTPVLTPTDESGQRGDSVGISGWAINPHLSGADLVFTHPFGGDWEFFIAPDPQYLTLLAPNNLLTGVSDSDTQEYRDATAKANDPNGLNLGMPGVLGVEVDGAFVPGGYQAQQGDRVAAFGRWIVDCGHPDFHTEIHPPLMLAVARPMGTGTSVKVISRPFLVSQEFGDGALRQHLDKEIAKVESLTSLRIEVHAQLISPPFSGLHIMRFFAGPSTPRRSPNDQLLLSCHFTVRSGVAVEVTRSVNPDEVQVLVSMNDVNYQPTPPPPKHSVSKQIADLGADALGPGIGIGILNQLFNPIANLILARGILIDLYDPPQPQSAHDSENIVTNTVVDQNMRALTPVSVGDDQPFPIYGWLTLQWG